MPPRVFAAVIRTVSRGQLAHPPGRDPTGEYGIWHVDSLGRSLAATPSRRHALRLFASTALAALAAGQSTEETAAHNALKKCRKLKQRTERKRCIKKAKAHNKKHKKPKKRKPNAACRGESTLMVSETYGRFAQTFTEPNGGKLRAASIRFRRYSAQSGTFHLAVNTVNPATGYPTNFTIATSVPVPVQDFVAGLLTFQFPVPATLVANRQYALVLSRSVPDGYSVFHQEFRTCRGGALFTSPSNTGDWFLPTVLPTSGFYETFVSR